MIAALNGIGNSAKSKKESPAAQVFRSVFSDEEWAEMEASDQAIADGDESQLRMLRLERQRKLIWDTIRKRHNPSSSIFSKLNSYSGDQKLSNRIDVSNTQSNTIDTSLCNTQASPFQLHLEQNIRTKP